MGTTIHHRLNGQRHSFFQNDTCTRFAIIRDGRFLVTNTLESRLDRARDLLKGEIFSTLGGG